MCFAQGILDVTAHDRRRIVQHSRRSAIVGAGGDGATRISQRERQLVLHARLQDVVLLLTLSSFIGHSSTPSKIPCGAIGGLDQGGVEALEARPRPDADQAPRG